MGENRKEEVDWDHEESVEEGAEKYLTFGLGDEEYGINIRHVTEIIGVLKITEMPDSEEYLKGVINLRGKVIPVIDMRLRFHLEERDYDERTCIVVVNVDNVSVGLIVDTVSEVLDIDEANIDPAPTIAIKDLQGAIEGLGRVEGQVKILLNTRKILYTETLEALAEQFGEEAGDTTPIA